MSELKPYFIEPKKCGRTQIKDKYNDLILQARSEWARDKLFDMIVESEQLRKERDELKTFIKTLSEAEPYAKIGNYGHKGYEEHLSSTWKDEAKKLLFCQRYQD